MNRDHERLRISRYRPHLPPLPLPKTTPVHNAPATASFAPFLAAQFNLRLNKFAVCWIIWSCVDKRTPICTYILLFQWIKYRRKWILTECKNAHLRGSFLQLNFVRRLTHFVKKVAGSIWTFLPLLSKEQFCRVIGIF